MINKGFALIRQGIYPGEMYTCQVDRYDKMRTRTYRNVSDASTNRIKRHCAALSVEFDGGSVVVYGYVD